MSGGLELGAIARAKAEHRAALARALTGMPADSTPEPTPDPTPAVPFFDGGARRSPPLPAPSHGDWLLAVLRGEVPRDDGS
jgi:hypothetical protein